MAGECKPEDLVREAKQLIDQGYNSKSRDLLRDYLLYDNALLWLARATLDVDEALQVVELALMLAPESEMVRRAIEFVRNMPKEEAKRSRELSRAIALETKMTLKQARATIWPFREINRPIGEAFEHEIITIKDLIWASQNAYDPQIKEAAKTVLFYDLLGAEESQISPVLNVIRVSRHSESEENKSLFWVGGIAGAAIIIAFDLIILFILLVTKALPPVWIMAVNLMSVLIGLPLIFIASKQFDRQTDRLLDFRIGRRGEDHVVEALRKHFDGQWTLFRNFVRPNRKWGDIDLLLVGPRGIWVFEVKSYTGEIRAIGDRWEKKGKRGWHRISKNPGEQAKRNAVQIKEYLKQQGIRVSWVKEVVIWAGDPDDIRDTESTIEIHDPAQPVWRLEDIDQDIEQIWQDGRPLSEDQINQIVDVLNQAVDEFQQSIKR